MLVKFFLHAGVCWQANYINIYKVWVDSKLEGEFFRVQNILSSLAVIIFVAAALVIDIILFLS